ncbi:MAG: CpsB/CapC family capsule biosynthesis tyrosine phosphatase [Bacteroidota bacterium]
MKIDMHSHLIPGIDDGAPDMDTAIMLIEGLKELGIERIITTPHVMSDLYPNTSATILSGRDEVRRELQQRGIHIGFDAAAEYLLDEGFEAKLQADNLLTFGNQHVLVEMSFVAPPPNLENLLFQLQVKGYRPIMAHPERYLYWHATKEKYTALKEKGVQLQLNMLSLTGYYGESVKAVANYMLKKGLVDYLGTDLHHEQHLAQLKQIEKVAIFESDLVAQHQL